MSFTRDDVPFKSTGHGPDFEFVAQICSLPNLPMHGRRFSSSSVVSFICSTLAIVNKT